MAMKMPMAIMPEGFCSAQLGWVGANTTQASVAETPVAVRLATQPPSQAEASTAG